MDLFANESDSCVVEQAKGALMLRYGIGAREALAVLDRWAQEAGVAVGEVATALVHGICLGQVSPGTEVVVRWLEQRMRGEAGDVRTQDEGAAEGSASGGSAGVVPVSSPAPTVPAPRQWRYSSAVHAARVLRSR
jgi:hypothetical protein